jgi:hypothetical protein
VGIWRVLRERGEDRILTGMARRKTFCSEVRGGDVLALGKVTAGQADS